MKDLLLSFDVEEFDLPLELGLDISKDEMFNIGYIGLIEVLQMLDDKKATFFVSCEFAKKYSDLIRDISEKHEVALHCLKHSDDYSKMSDEEFRENIKEGKRILEKIIGKEVVGFRSPRMQKLRYNVLKELGFIYDSSYNPIYMPGRYNNFFGTRNLFYKDNVLVIPCTAIPIFRIPLFWLTFRNFGLLFARLFFFLSFQNYINLYFHPWEFTDLKELKLPWYVKRNTGDKVLNNLNQYIQNYNLITFSDFVKKVH